MMKKILLLVGLALLASCSKEHNSPEQPQTEVAMGAPASLALAGGLNLSFGAGGQSLVDELGSDESNNARALDVFQKPDESFSFEINIEKYKGEKMQLFLRKAGSTDVTSVLAPVKITQLPNGKYHMRVEMENVSPVGAADFSTGEWFITGFWGGGPQDAVANSTKHKVKDVSPTSPATVGDKVEMGIPLGFPWTKITAVQKGPTVLLKHEDLKIQPMGILLCLTPNNRTVYNVDLSKLDKELQGFAVGGYFDVSAAPVVGEFPKFNRGFEENIGNEGVEVLPYNISIPSGQKTTKPIYLWAIPTEDTATDYLMSFSFMSKERTSMDSDINTADQFQTNGLAKFTDRYTIDYSFGTKPKHGESFVKEMKIRTSPMITEYFMNRVRNGQTYTGAYYNSTYGQWFEYEEGVDGINHPYFYGYVEIHNPNLDDINLEHYALCRIANIRATGVDTYGRRFYLPNYPYFHPMADDKFRESNRTGSIGAADRTATKETESNKALLLSLQLKNGSKSSFQPNSLGFKSQFETVSRRIEEAQIAIPDNDNRVERVKFFKGGLTGSKAILKGGKTMLVLGNGFINTMGETGGFYFKKDGQWQQTYQKDNTLAKIADPRVTPLPKAVYDKILGDDECQIVVAVDNFMDKSTNPGVGAQKPGEDYYSVYSGAGVMNLGWHDALFIVQKHKSNPKRRRIVDATSANPFARVNNWKQFASMVTLASETETGKAHFRVRTVAQHLPEFLNFTEQQWHPALHNSASRVPVKVSPGRRSAVGFESYQ